MYAFYTGVPTFSLNNLMYRRNQYSIDESEAKVQHQKIMYLTRRKQKDPDLKMNRADRKVFYGKYIDDFESFRKLRTLVEEPITLDFEKEHEFKVYNPYDQAIDLKKLKFNIAYLTEFKDVKDRIAIEPRSVDETLTALPARDTVTFRFKFPKPEMEQPSYFRIGISENGLLHGINGSNTKLE